MLAAASARRVVAVPALGAAPMAAVCPAAARRVHPRRCGGRYRGRSRALAVPVGRAGSEVPVAGGHPRRDNLPTELTEFIGRERELHEVHGLLRAARLVTLTGTGGVGKTRLALRVAGMLRGTFTDGVWLVELAAVEEPGLVPAAVAAVLGVAERPARSVRSGLEGYLQDARLLLILDNGEHVVDACASLVTGLLAVAPGLCVLMTSREAAHAPGEKSFTVGPLPTPDPEHL